MHYTTEDMLFYLEMLLCIITNLLLSSSLYIINCAKHACNTECIDDKKHLKSILSRNGVSIGSDVGGIINLHSMNMSSLCFVLYSKDFFAVGSIKCNNDMSVNSSLLDTRAVR